MKKQVHTKALRFLVTAGMLAITTTGFSQTGYFGKFFTHVATAGNQAGNWANLTHADLDGNSSALAITTQNWSVNSVYNNFNYGLWYTGSNWAVYNENTSDSIPVGSAYNVLIPSANGTVFNQDLNAMPNGAAFNVLVADTQAVNTGVSEIENANNVYLFPNPAADNITIGYVVSEAANVTVKLVAADGREMETLYAGTHTSGNYTLQRNIGQLAKGIYFYVVNVNGVVSRKTLVKN